MGEAAEIRGSVDSPPLQHMRTLVFGLQLNPPNCCGDASIHNLPIVYCMATRAEEDTYSVIFVSPAKLSILVLTNSSDLIGALLNAQDIC